MSEELSTESQGIVTSEESVSREVTTPRPNQSSVTSIVEGPQVQSPALRNFFTRTAPAAAITGLTFVAGATLRPSEAQASPMEGVLPPEEVIKGLNLTPPQHFIDQYEELARGENGKGEFVEEAKQAYTVSEILERAVRYSLTEEGEYLRARDEYFREKGKSAPKIEQPRTRRFLDVAYDAISKAIRGVSDTKLSVPVPISRRGSDVTVVYRRALLVTALGMNIVDTVLNQMSKESPRDIFPVAPEGLLSVKGNKLEIKDDNPQTKKQILQMMLDSKETMEDETVLPRYSNFRVAFMAIALGIASVDDFEGLQNIFQSLENNKELCSQLIKWPPDESNQNMKYRNIFDSDVVDTLIDEASGRTRFTKDEKMNLMTMRNLSETAWYDKVKELIAKI